MENYNVKNIREEFRKKGVFYTPKELAEHLKSFLPLEEVKEIYDPTCGSGGLLSVFNDDVIKYGQDINKEAVEWAINNIPNFNGYVGDTLKNPAFKDKKFKYIIANPPFSMSWEPPTAIEQQMDDRFKDWDTLAPKSKADYAFIQHIIHYLADDGMAVVLSYPGILFRGNSEGKIRKELIERNLIEKIIHVSGDKFVDTNIATNILVLNKNKLNTDIEFIDESCNTIIVSIDEVRDNDYKLTANIYKKEYEPTEEEKNKLEELQRKQLITQRLAMVAILRKEYLKDMELNELIAIELNFKDRNINYKRIEQLTIEELNKIIEDCNVHDKEYDTYYKYIHEGKQKGMDMTERFTEIPDYFKKYIGESAFD